MAAVHESAASSRGLKFGGRSRWTAPNETAAVISSVGEFIRARLSGGGGGGGAEAGGLSYEEFWRKRLDN